MTIPSGVQKYVAIGKEGAATWGVAAGAGTGAKMRRVTATLDLVKNTFESSEIRTDQQVVDFRHGMRRVEGSLNGELSCLSYQAIWAALFRNAWAAGVTTGAVITISTNTGTKIIARSSGSFVTDGFKVGDLVLASGFTNSPNNTQWLITALTATNMTVHDPDNVMVTESAGASVTIVVDGRKLQVPSTGHTNDSFTIEQFYEMGTTDVSELSVGCRISSFSVSIQPGAMATVTFGILGKDMTTSSTAYFSSPTAEATTAVMAGPVGYIYLDGAAIAVITGINIEGNMGAETGEVVGSLTTPDVFMGRFRVSGTLSAYFLDSTLWTSFKNESEVGVVVRLKSGIDGASGQSFMLRLPRIKLGGNTKDDKETGGIMQNVPFTALKYVGAGNFDATTMVLQDTEVTTA